MRRSWRREARFASTTRIPGAMRAPGTALAALAAPDSVTTSQELGSAARAEAGASATSASAARVLHLRSAFRPTSQLNGT
jgi:hypothetical protein